MSCDSAATPTPSTPKEGSRPNTPTIAPQGPSQLLTALLARLPDGTNRTLIDQAAVDFAFLNSKAARKRLVKVRAVPSGGGYPDAEFGSSSRRFRKRGRTCYRTILDWWPH